MSAAHSNNRICNVPADQCPHGEKLDRIEEKLDGMDRYLRGDHETLGVTVRLDRLEQSENRRNWWTTTSVGAALAALTGAVASWLQK